jgi:allantoin racemase
MKIWCQLPISMPESHPAYEPYYALLRADYATVKRPGTEVTVKDVPTGLSSPDEITYVGNRFRNDREILTSMLQAEAEGYDAVAGACFFDGAIRAAQQMMDIPVVGPAQASMQLAMLLGTRFATITSDPRWIPEMEAHISEVGMREHAIGPKLMRAITLPSDIFLGCLGGDYQPAVDNFTGIAEGCIEDGADVLIAGCGLLSPMLTVAGLHEIGGVPVIDPMLASLKYAEMLVDYRQSGFPVKSTAGSLLA